MSLVDLQLTPRGVATLTLNDPRRRNAMGAEMARSFAQRIGELQSHSGLRSVILTGAGSAFAAGGDLEMLREKAAAAPEANRVAMLEFYDAFLGILKLPVPIIAAINGSAIGAGFCLALACEVRVASTEAKLGLTFTRLGLHPGMGATCLLPRIAGWAVASDLLISGRVVNAAEARTMGLVNDIVAPELLMARAARSPNRPCKSVRRRSAAY